MEFNSPGKQSHLNPNFKQLLPYGHISVWKKLWNRQNTWSGDAKVVGYQHWQVSGISCSHARPEYNALYSIESRLYNWKVGFQVGSQAVHGPLHTITQERFLQFYLQGTEFGPNMALVLSYKINGCLLLLLFRYYGKYKIWLIFKMFYQNVIFFKPTFWLIKLDCDSITNSIIILYVLYWINLIILVFLKLKQYLYLIYSSFSVKCFFSSFSEYLQMIFIKWPYSWQWWTFTNIL